MPIRPDRSLERCDPPIEMFPIKPAHCAAPSNFTPVTCACESDRIAQIGAAYPIQRHRQFGPEPEILPVKVRLFFDEIGGEIAVRERAGLTECAQGRQSEHRSNTFLALAAIQL